MRRLPHETLINPTDLWCNGRLSTTVPAQPGGPVTVGVTGGPTMSYNIVGTMARIRITTTADEFELDVATTRDFDLPWFARINDGTHTLIQNGLTNPVMDILIGVAKAAPAGGTVRFETLAFKLPYTGSRTIEIYVPYQGSGAVDSTAYGCYPIRLRANRAFTLIAPAAQTYRLGIHTDSIGCGFFSLAPQTTGYSALMARGMAAQSGPYWKGAYSGATTYAAGELVSSGPLIWQKKSAAAAGTAPVVGADWNAYAFNGTVELWQSWGGRSINSLWGTSGNRTTYAADLLAHNFTHLLIADGINDYIAAGSISKATFTANEAARLTAIAAAQAGLKIVRLSPLLYGTNGTEAANGNGDTPDTYRTIISSAVSAASGFTTAPSYLNGKTLLSVTDFYLDNLHPSTGGHAKLPNLILPSFV